MIVKFFLQILIKIKLFNRHVTRYHIIKFQLEFVRFCVQLKKCYKQYLKFKIKLHFRNFWVNGRLKIR